MEPEPMTWSVGQAAHALGISRALAYELVRRGELPTLRFGKRIVIPRKALAELIDSTPRVDDPNPRPVVGLR